MSNIITPFKASFIALAASKLVHVLGMDDAQASYVADALFVLITAGVAYVVPADFGSGISARLLAWVLRMRMPAVALLIGASTLALGGCAAKMQPPPGPPPTAEEQAALDQVKREKKCQRALLASTGLSTTAAVLLRNSNDADLKDGIASGLKGLEEASDAYCEAVITGVDTDAELVAYRSLQAAMDELTRRLLDEAPSPAS